MVLSRNVINLTPGVYLVRYGTDYNSTCNVLPTISLQRNGVTIDSTTRTGDYNSTNNLTGNHIFVEPGYVNISLLTNQSNSITYDKNYILFERIADL